MEMVWRALPLLHQQEDVPPIISRVIPSRTTVTQAARERSVDALKWRANQATLLQ